MALRHSNNPYTDEVRKSDEALVTRRAELADRNHNWLKARMTKSSNPNKGRSGRLTEHTEALLEDGIRQNATA